MNAGQLERALTFACEGETLLGLLHPCANSGPTGDTGVLVIVGGPQYRVGSHRQFVQLARKLAAAGHPVFRFDARGMGDSSGELRGFEHMQQDIGAAVEAFVAAAPNVRRVLLWGLCDGASAALLYLHDKPDPRICGLCLLNPWVRSAATLAATRVKHYYGQRLLQADFWRKLFSGRLARGTASELLASLTRASLARLVRNSASAAARGPTAPYQARMASTWMADRRPLLLVLSSSDYTAKEFGEAVASEACWRGALTRPAVRVETLEADHTFSTPGAKAALEQLTLRWLQSLCFTPALER